MSGRNLCVSSETSHRNNFSHIKGRHGEALYQDTGYALLVSCLHILTCLKLHTVRGGPAHDNTHTCIFKPFIAGLDVYIILMHNTVFKICSIFNIEEHVLQIAYRNVVNYIVFIVHV